MNWEMEVKRGGVVEEKRGGSMQDQFEEMARAAGQSASKAHVTAKVSHWGDHVSVSFSVSVECPQTEAWMQHAAQHAYTSACRFVNEATSRLDSSMPMLNTGA